MFFCVLYGVHFLLKIKRHLFFQSEAVFGRVQIEMQVRKVEKISIIKYIFISIDDTVWTHKKNRKI